MTDYISITIQRGRDGGLSIHENTGGNESVHVFSGDTKQVTDYFSKRVAELAAAKASEPLDDRIVSYEPRRDTERRAALNPRVFADRRTPLDQEEIA
jgi:hypothetical protein